MLRAVALRLESGAITSTSTPVDLAQGAAGGLQAGGGDPVVVGEQDAHASIPGEARTGRSDPPEGRPCPREASTRPKFVVN